MEKIMENQRPLTKFMEDMGSLRQFLTIQQVSQKLDIPKPTLRFWEKEFVGGLIYCGPDFPRIKAFFF
ncbi:MAG: MerR family transcriptional regulator [Desulfobacteraceae bacterium]|nr:MerR family transcriptional regulator [Desulfobacteraceae bacterium]